MLFGSKGLKVAIAFSLGLGVLLLPRPRGTTFDVKGDPEHRLLAHVTGQYRLIGDGGGAVYRLQRAPPATTTADPDSLDELVNRFALDGVTVETVDGLSPEGHRFLAVMACLLFLFVVEPIPLEITAILIGVLLVASRVTPVQDAWASYMHPVVVFIMCCLIFAVALEKAGLTQRLGQAIARRAGSSVVRFTFLLAIGLGIASSVMHDAAAAAIGIAVMLPLMRAAGIEPHTNTARFMVIALAFACSCGGMGTLVGGGRCMVAAAFLKEFTGIELDFLDWIKYAFPLAVVTVPTAVFTVYLVFRPDTSIRLPRYDESIGPWTTEQGTTLAILLAVFVAWLTKGVHGIDYSVTGMAGVALLVFSGGLRWRDIHENLEWGTALFIFGGGICLGLAMNSSGAARYFAHLFFPLVEGRGWLVLFAGLCVFGALITNAMANVAAAALILPIAIPLAQLEGVNPAVLALGLGTSTSFALLLVIGCPPNAIAYSYRMFRAVDLTKAGAVVTPILLIVLIVGAALWWDLLGLV